MKLASQAFDVKTQICASFQETCILTFVFIDLLNDSRDLFDCRLRRYEEGDNVPDGGDEAANFVGLNCRGGRGRGN